MSLRILLDENMPPLIAANSSSSAALWHVRHVRDVGLRGATDDAVFQWAQIDGSIVVTFDEDFADARMFPAGTHAGVIRLRVWPSTIENASAALGRVLEVLSDEELCGSLVIVGQQKIRVRRTARHG